MAKEITRYIKHEVERELWARAAGRCQFSGCNRILYKSPVTQDHVNISEKAHIYSFSETGPRGWGPFKKKPKGLNDVSNLILKADFVGNSALPKMLYDIAVEYEAAKKYEKAEGIYKNITAKYPDSGDNHCALGSQKHLVLVYSATGRDNEAKAAMDKLIKDNTGRQELVVALYDIALGYEGAGKYEQAAEIYQKILPLDQKSMRGLKAPVDIPKSQILGYIDAGDDGKVMPAVEKLIADNPGHPYLPAAVSRVAEQYQKKAAQLEVDGRIGQAKDYTRKAAGIYEIAAMRLPDSTAYAKTSGIMKEFETATPKACSAAGDCYRKLDEYEKSNQCYQKLVDVYPKFISAGSTLYMMGQNYQQMGKSGLISKSEAEAKVKAVYEQLLAKYPDCKAAAGAQRWLGRQGVSK